MSSDESVLYFVGGKKLKKIVCGLFLGQKFASSVWTVLLENSQTYFWVRAFRHGSVGLQEMTIFFSPARNWTTTPLKLPIKGDIVM